MNRTQSLSWGTTKLNQNNTSKLRGFWEGWTTKHSSKTIHYFFTDKKIIKWQVWTIPHLETSGNQWPPWKDPCFQSCVPGRQFKSESVLTLPCLNCLGWNALKSLLWNCNSLGGVEDPLQATSGGHALPHSQSSSMRWQGAERSHSTGHGSCCHVTPMAADITSLPSHCEMTIHQLDHTELKCSLVPESGTENRSPGSHCSLLRFLWQRRRWLAMVIQKVLSCCEKSFSSAVPYYWSRFVNRHGISMEGIVPRTDFSINMIGDKT